MNDPIVLYDTVLSSQKAQPTNYHIVRFLNLPSEAHSALQKIYRDTFSGRDCPATPPIGPFSDMTGLDRYCFKITQQFNLKGIGLLELERYNRLVDETHHLMELKMILSKKCDYIENPDYKNAGILKRLLN